MNYNALDNGSRKPDEIADQQIKSLAQKFQKEKDLMDWFQKNVRTTNLETKMIEFIMQIIFKQLVSQGNQKDTITILCKQKFIII